MVLAAICITPAIPVKARILNRKKATVWTAPMGRSAVGILESHGARFEPSRVVVDGGVITADGPNSTFEFAKNLPSVLTEKSKEDNIGLAVDKRLRLLISKRRKVSPLEAGFVNDEIRRREFWSFLSALPRSFFL